MPDVVVVRQTERVVVQPQERAVTVAAPGPQGSRGAMGPMGPPGADSQIRATKRWHGEGPPTVVVGAAPGDEYLDLLSGDLYTLS